MRCHCGVDVDDQPDTTVASALIIHALHHLVQIEDTMTENQQHLDNDINAVKTAVLQIVTELKAQQANGQPLDFTAADALVASVQGEAKADAPAVPSPSPSPSPSPVPTSASVATAPVVDPNASAAAAPTVDPNAPVPPAAV